MRVLVVGTGAVGGFFGGRLAKAGVDVTFLARGNHLDALRSKGLTVRSINGDFNIPIHVCQFLDNSSVVFDLVIFSVKGYDLASVCPLVKGAVGEKTVILPLLNGVESEQELGNFFGPEKVIGGVSFLGASVEAPGFIEHSASGFLTIGELDGEKRDRCEHIKALFDGARVPCKISQHIKSDIWMKMTWNVGFNAVTAITGAMVSEVLASDETRTIIYEAMAEVMPIAKKEGVFLPDDLVERTISKTGKAGSIKTSMLQDIERGRPTEVDSINGAIVRLGERADLPTPVNGILRGLVTFLERKHVQ